MIDCTFVCRCSVLLLLLWPDNATRHHLPVRDAQLLLDAHYCKLQFILYSSVSFTCCTLSNVEFNSLANGVGVPSVDGRVWQLPHSSRILQRVQHVCWHALPLLLWVHGDSVLCIQSILMSKWSFYSWCGVIVVSSCSQWRTWRDMTDLCRNHILCPKTSWRSSTNPTKPQKGKSEGLKTARDAA